MVIGRIVGIAPIAVLALAQGCGTQDSGGTAAAAGPGCSAEVAEIRLAPEHTAYDDRMSHGLGVKDPQLVPLSEAGELADIAAAAAPESIDGAPAVAITETSVRDREVIVTYGGDETAAHQWETLESGGISYTAWADRTDGDSLARAILADHEQDPPLESGLPRAVLVEVGPYDALVSQADPDQHDIREHNVIWTDETGASHRISAVRAPEELVAMAREVVC